MAEEVKPPSQAGGGRLYIWWQAQGQSLLDL